MTKWQKWDKIKYQAQLDPGFANQIASIPGGEKLFGCIQCGTCSATCPLSTYMDYTPRRIIAMSRAGFKGEVLSSQTTWLCASCYACTVECPKQIKITDIMYAIKRLAIREEVYPKHFPIPALAREFFRSVEKDGRQTEGRLLMSLYLKTNPFALFKQAGLGMKLFRQGRMKLGKDTIKRKEELRKILKSLEKEYYVKAGKGFQPEGKVVS
jgi:heterodisulfide reductase subunit C